MKRGLVSVIMPARNASAYIEEAIRSVIAQSYTSWELLIVDNGSTDNTYDIAHSFLDSRITVLREPHKLGIGYARNKAMHEMVGEYFCFLDADDRLTPDSLSCRIGLFQQDPELSFVDGWVETWNRDFSQCSSVCKPSFRGYPLHEVVSLSARCVCAVSWMVRRKPGIEYRFMEGWSHAEDLAFYISIARQGKYSYTEQPVYQVRRGHQSTMSDLKGLQDGYGHVLRYMQTIPELSNEELEAAR
ncbi:MAG: hypothetical protein RL220_1287, partial [Bacteroidota bacterium]